MRALYNAHGKALYRFLLGVTVGDQQFAEDLVQETLVRAWKHLDRLAPNVDTLRPWLFTVARRIAIDAARARRARTREVGAVDLTLVPDPRTAATGGRSPAVRARSGRLGAARVRVRAHRAILECLYGLDGDRQSFAFHKLRHGHSG